MNVQQPKTTEEEEWEDFLWNPKNGKKY